MPRTEHSKHWQLQQRLAVAFQVLPPVIIAATEQSIAVPSRSRSRGKKQIMFLSICIFKCLWKWPYMLLVCNQLYLRLLYDSGGLAIQLIITYLYVVHLRSTQPVLRLPLITAKCKLQQFAMTWLGFCCKPPMPLKGVKICVDCRCSLSALALSLISQM